MENSLNPVSNPNSQPVGPVNSTEGRKFKTWQLIAAFGAGIAIVSVVAFSPKSALQGNIKMKIEVECNGDKDCEINKKLDILLEYFSLYTGTLNSLSNFTQQWTQFTGQWTQFTGQWTKFTGEMKKDVQEIIEATENDGDGGGAPGAGAPAPTPGEPAPAPVPTPAPAPGGGQPAPATPAPASTEPAPTPEPSSPEEG